MEISTPEHLQQSTPPSLQLSNFSLVNTGPPLPPQYFTQETAPSVSQQELHENPRLDMILHSNQPRKRLGMPPYTTCIE